MKDSRMSAIIVLYDMHTTYFANAIVGISDKDSHTGYIQRPIILHGLPVALLSRDSK